MAPGPPVSPGEPGQLGLQQCRALPAPRAQAHAPAPRGAATAPSPAAAGPFAGGCQAPPGPPHLGEMQLASGAPGADDQVLGEEEALPLALLPQREGAQPPPRDLPFLRHRNLDEGPYGGERPIPGIGIGGSFAGHGPQEQGIAACPERDSGKCVPKRRGWDRGWDRDWPREPPAVRVIGAQRPGGHWPRPLVHPCTHIAWVLLRDRTCPGGQDASRYFSGGRKLITAKMHILLRDAIKCSAETLKHRKFRNGLYF